MTNSPLVAKQPLTITRQKRWRLGGPHFDYVITVFICWFLGGLFLDAWAHNHGLVDSTFFTPWHAVLYSGYAACAVVLTLTVFINRMRGFEWRQAIPDGYAFSVLGVPLFAFAGVGDLIWHTLFGFEVGIEPLLSPTHLLLALGALLIMSGPFRAAWERTEAESGQKWAKLFPAIISLTAILSLFTFFTSFAHPFVQTGLLIDPSVDDGEKSRGAAAVLLQAAILMGVLLLALRRWRLPVGTLALVFTLNIALMSAFGQANQYRLIPSALLTGVIADALLWYLRPSIDRAAALRIFAFVVPVVFYLDYFVPLMIQNNGIQWSIHLWLGSTVMAGIVGLLLSYLLMPPCIPAERITLDPRE